MANPEPHWQQPPRDSHQADGESVEHALPIPNADTFESIRAYLSNKNYTGAWTVPERMRVSGFASTVKLDFREAIITTPTVTIDLHCGLCDVKVWLPEGGSPVIHVEQSLGDLKVRSATSGSPNGPKIILTGQIFGGDVRVFGHDYKTFFERLSGK